VPRGGVGPCPRAPPRLYVAAPSGPSSAARVGIDDAGDSAAANAAEGLVRFAFLTRSETVNKHSTRVFQVQEDELYLS
jgi:hypothetical protein